MDDIPAKEENPVQADSTSESDIPEISNPVEKWVQLSSDVYYPIIVWNFISPDSIYVQIEDHKKYLVLVAAVYKEIIQMYIFSVGKNSFGKLKST